MQNSGTKLVLTLVGVAFVLGIISWWYRYEAAHRASQFWGPEASRLIAESKGFEVIHSVPGEEEEVRIDLSKARGQAHLRHAFLSDSNFVWAGPVDYDTKQWKWRLRFYEGEREAWVLLSDEFNVIGRRDPQTDSVLSYSCKPMTASLKQYFEALGLIVKPPAVGASNTAE